MGTSVIKNTCIAIFFFSKTLLVLRIVSKINTFLNIVSKPEIQHCNNSNGNLFYLGLFSFTQTVSRQQRQGQSPVHPNCLAIPRNGTFPSGHNKKVKTQPRLPRTQHIVPGYSTICTRFHPRHVPGSYARTLH